MSAGTRDQVIIDGLEVEAIIGIHDWERRVRQVLRLDVAVGTDVARVAATDDIALAVDYSVLAECLGDFIRVGEYRLLETLAEDAAAMILAEFAVPWVKLAVRKPGAVAAADSVGVVIERARGD